MMIKLYDCIVILLINEKGSQNKAHRGVLGFP